MTGSSKLWFTDDDTNFIGNDTNLDSISEVAADYSSGDFSATEIETASYDKFSGDSVIITSAKSITD